MRSGVREGWLGRESGAPDSPSRRCKRGRALPENTAIALLGPLRVRSGFVPGPGGGCLNGRAARRGMKLLGRVALRRRRRGMMTVRSRRGSSLESFRFETVSPCFDAAAAV